MLQGNRQGIRPDVWSGRNPRRFAHYSCRSRDTATPVRGASDPSTYRCPRSGPYVCLRRALFKVCQAIEGAEKTPGYFARIGRIYSGIEYEPRVIRRKFRVLRRLGVNRFDSQYSASYQPVHRGPAWCVSVQYASHKRRAPLGLRANHEVTRRRIRQLCYALRKGVLRAIARWRP